MEHGEKGIQKARTGPREKEQKHIGPLDGFQERSAVQSAGHGIAEGTGQAAEHTGLEEKELERLGLRREHLGDEVGQQMAVLIGERRQEALRWLLQFLSEQGKGEQMQTGNPAFCAPCDMLDGRS